MYRRNKEEVEGLQVKRKQVRGKPLRRHITCKVEAVWQQITTSFQHLPPSGCRTVPILDPW